MAVTPSTSQMRFSGRGVFDTLNCPTPASTAINSGDLLWLNSGVATPASSFTWTTNLAGTQPGFRQLFLGVANEDKSVLDVSTRSIQVITRGIFVFPCAALGGALHIGSFVGPDKDANNNSLALQTLANVATNTLSIGTLFEEVLTGATALRVLLQSWLIYTQQGTTT